MPRFPAIFASVRTSRVTHGCVVAAVAWGSEGKGSALSLPHICLKSLGAFYIIGVQWGGNNGPVIVTDVTVDSFQIWRSASRHFVRLIDFELRNGINWMNKLATAYKLEAEIWRKSEQTNKHVTK